ncbi:MAG: TlpA family protein disulfide reductase [Spirochaetales bacterium]|nr:TlpA family protein disulfide reductase [Spirochaetales bacterium]
MIRNILLVTCLLCIIVSCNPGEQGLPGIQLQKLNKMNTEAQKIKDGLKDKSGKEYLAEHDKYYALMMKRAEDALQYLHHDNPAEQTREDLQNTLDIAKIAQDGEKIIQLIKILFSRFPDTRNEKELIQTYFIYAYLLEPGEIEQYVDITIFPPEEQLYCYYMLALGFFESDDIQNAGSYFKQAENLLKEIISDKTKEHTLPLLYIVGLRSFIAFKLGDKQESFRILRDAEMEFIKEFERTTLRLYENRLNLLGRNAPDLESKKLIGGKETLNFSSLKGKVILLDFFSWDCETCNTTIPMLSNLQKEINDDDFMIIGTTRYTGSYEHDTNISEESEYEYMKNHYYKKRKVNWPVSISTTSMYNYGINATPLYILIDKRGIVRDGYFISNFLYLKKKIRLLLEES